MKDQNLRHSQRITRLRSWVMIAWGGDISAFLGTPVTLLIVVGDHYFLQLLVGGALPWPPRLSLSRKWGAQLWSRSHNVGERGRGGIRSVKPFRGQESGRIGGVASLPDCDGRVYCRADHAPGWRHPSCKAWKRTPTPQFARVYTRRHRSGTAKCTPPSYWRGFWFPGRWTPRRRTRNQAPLRRRTPRPREGSERSRLTTPSPLAASFRRRQPRRWRPPACAPPPSMPGRSGAVFTGWPRSIGMAGRSMRRLQLRAPPACLVTRILALLEWSLPGLMASLSHRLDVCQGLALLDPAGCGWLWLLVRVKTLAPLTSTILLLRCSASKFIFPSACSWLLAIVSLCCNCLAVEWIFSQHNWNAVEIFLFACIAYQCFSS